jgi:hypothetical protein
LAGVIRLDTAVRLRQTSTSGYRNGDGADLIVFDRWLPSSPASQPMLCIAPPSATWLGSAGVTADVAAWTSAQAHQILEGVEPVMLDLASVRDYRAADLTVIATADGGAPIVGIQDRAERRLVLINFAVDAGLRGAPALPVLVSNAIEWLARPYRGAARPPGPVALPTSTSRVVSPGGQSIALVRVADRVLATLAQPGLYLVRAGGSQSVLPVNAGRADLSNLMRSTLSSPAASIGNPLGPDRSWWLTSVLIALALLTIEWWTWQRRITV